MEFFDKHYKKLFDFVSPWGYDNESDYEKFSGRYGRYIRMVDIAYSIKDIIVAMNGAVDVYNRYKDKYEFGLFKGYAFVLSIRNLKRLRMFTMSSLIVLLLVTEKNIKYDNG